MISTNEWIKVAIDICINIYNQTEDNLINKFKMLEKEYNQMIEKCKKDIFMFFREQLEIPDCIFVYSCFINYTKIELLQKEMFDLIIEADVDCIVGSMMELQTRYYDYAVDYSKKRILHKKNIQRFEKELSLQYNYTPVCGRNNNTIIIVTEQIINQLHAPTKMILEIVYTLQQKMGYEILIIACPCNKKLDMDVWYCGRTMNSITQQENQISILKYKDTAIKYYQSGLKSEKFYDIFYLIDNLKPKFVLGMGMINPIMDIIAKYNTLVAINMNTFFPISEAQIIFKKENKGFEELDGYEFKNQVCKIIDEKFPMDINREIKDFTYEEIGVPKDKFLIAVVGGRLDNELDNEFIDLIKKILITNHDAVIVFIGGCKKAKNYFKNEILLERVVVLEYCKELISTLSKMHLFLNPKRKGGGVSSMIALNAGIPVVTLPDCDVASNVGKEFVVENYEEMIETVNRYITDNEFYMEKVKRAKKFVENYENASISEYMKKIIDVVEEIISEEE